MFEFAVAKHTFTRRDILAAFLGVPFALAACRSRADVAALPEGEIVGASDGIGHLIRDGLRPEPPTDAWERAGVVIVGGGVAGLAAAWRFLKAGFEDFVLLELEPAPGGLPGAATRTASCRTPGARTTCPRL